MVFFSVAVRTRISNIIMRKPMYMVIRLINKCFGTALAGLLLSAFFSANAHAGIFETFITGEDGSDHVVFRVLFDPEVADSAVVTVAVKEARAGYRLDGIDFMPGTIDRVVVGAQVTSTTGGGGLRGVDSLQCAYGGDHCP